MSEDTKQPETRNTSPEKLHPYYKRLLIIAITALIVGVTWCLFPFWKQLFVSEKCPGIYWLFVAGSSSVLFCGLAFLLGGIGLFCLRPLFKSPHRKEATRRAMSVNELRTVLLGGAVGLTVFLRFGIATYLGDFVLLENTASFSTEKHAYHLSRYNILGFSDGLPYGLIECDALDVFCKQIDRIVVKGSAPKTPVLRHDGGTNILYVERNGETYYSVQLEE